MRIIMFAAWEKAKPVTENIRGLNFKLGGGQAYDHSSD
jgi:hypothetical protein